MRSRALGWLRRQTRRLGVEVERYPSRSVRTLSGHTGRVLSEMQVDCVIDVGANTGQYGTWMRQLGYRGPIVSFEPVEATFRELSKVCEHDPSWQAVHMALGAEDGVATMNVTESSVLASLRSPSEQAPGWLAADLHVRDRESVRMARLDTVIDEYVHPAVRRVFLKLDTQGWDLDVFAGAQGCLDRVVAVQTEVSVVPLYEEMPDWLDSLKTIRDAGFQPTWMSPVVTDGPIRALEFDCVLVRQAPTVGRS